MFVNWTFLRLKSDLTLSPNWTFLCWKVELSLQLFKIHNGGPIFLTLLILTH